MNRIPRLRHALALVTLALGLTAQNTLIVDAANGPGTSFLDIQPAIDAASDGDRILVRAGSYSGFVVDGKGLAILGEFGVLIDRSVQMVIRNTSASQPTVLADLNIGVPFFVFFNAVENCAGRVTMERVRLGGYATPFRFTDCDDVRIAWSQVPGGALMQRTRATITDSVIWVGPGLNFPHDALALEGSHVTLCRTNVSGQSLFLRFGVSSAITIDGNSSVLLTGDQNYRVAAGTGMTRSAITGSGRLERDPRVVVSGSNGAPPIVVGQEVVRHIPALSAIGAPVGGQVEIDLAGVSGAPFGLVLGIPGTPIALPGLSGTVDLGIVLIATGGVFGANPFHLSLPVSAGLPPGTELTWQAIAGDGAGGFSLSNSATYVRTR